MKKEEFLKLGVSEEIAVKCESASAEERDKQLSELKKTSGDSRLISYPRVLVQSLRVSHLFNLAFAQKLYWYQKQRGKNCHRHGHSIIFARRKQLRR